MPRLIESLPKYQKHRASGQAVVTLCGVEFYLGLHGTRVSRREYDRRVGEWLAAGGQLSVTPDASFDLTIFELLARDSSGSTTGGDYAPPKHDRFARWKLKST